MGSSIFSFIFYIFNRSYLIQHTPSLKCACRDLYRAWNRAPLKVRIGLILCIIVFFKDRQYVYPDNHFFTSTIDFL